MAPYRLIMEVMAQTTTVLSPSCPEDVFQLNRWWQMEYQGPYLKSPFLEPASSKGKV